MTHAILIISLLDQPHVYEEEPDLDSQIRLRGEQIQPVVVPCSVMIALAMLVPASKVWHVKHSDGVQSQSDACGSPHLQGVK